MYRHLTSFLQLTVLDIPEANLINLIIMSLREQFSSFRLIGVFSSIEKKVFRRKYFIFQDKLSAIVSRVTQYDVV